MSGSIGRNSKKFAEIAEKTKYRCGYCGTSVNHNNGTIDHIIPKHNGGKSNIDNLIYCCLKCNIAKRDRPLEHLRIRLAVNGANLPFKITSDMILKLESLGIDFSKVINRNMKFFFEERLS